MTGKQRRALEGYCDNLPPSAPGSRIGWYYDECPKHGKSEHIDKVGCLKCATEKEKSKAK